MGESTTYRDGNVVWVKLGPCWWPGEVVDKSKVPEDITFKKEPLAIVKFFEEDSFEYVKNENSISFYDCAKKHDYIKKGMDAFRQKHTHMENFPKHVCLAETLTNGDPNILSLPEFSPQKKRRSYASEYAAEIFGAPAPKKTPKGTAGGRSAKSRSSQRNTSFSSIPKGLKEGAITHRRFLGYDDHEVQILTQSRKLEDNEEDAKWYSCPTCSFRTRRLEVIMLHNKAHIQGVFNTSPVTKSSNKKPIRKRERAVRTNTTTFEEDLERLKKGLPLVCDLSDDKRSSSESSEDEESVEAETKENIPLQTEEKKKDDIKNDIIQTIMEWTDDEEEEIFPKKNEEKTKEEPPVLEKEDKKEVESVKKSDKSCFDFNEEEEEEVVATRTAGRKIPRVIPVIDKQKPTSAPSSPKKQKEEAEGTSKEDETLDEFIGILESTKMPALPDLPNTLKPEQNFHSGKTIKFPDKSADSIDQRKSASAKEMHEVATKLTNPKKRFVKSFEDYEMQQQSEQKKLEGATASDDIQNEEIFGKLGMGETVGDCENVEVEKPIEFVTRSVRSTRSKYAKQSEETSSKVISTKFSEKFIVTEHDFDKLLREHMLESSESTEYESENKSSSDDAKVGGRRRRSSKRSSIESDSEIEIIQADAANDVKTQEVRKLSRRRGTFETETKLPDVEKDQNKQGEDSKSSRKIEHEIGAIEDVKIAKPEQCSSKSSLDSGAKLVTEERKPYIKRSFLEFEAEMTESQNEHKLKGRRKSTSKRSSIESDNESTGLKMQEVTTSDAIKEVEIEKPESLTQVPITDLQKQSPTKEDSSTSVVKDSNADQKQQKIDEQTVKKGVKTARSYSTKDSLSEEKEATHENVAQKVEEKAAETSNSFKSSLKNDPSAQKPLEVTKLKTQLMTKLTTSPTKFTILSTTKNFKSSTICEEITSEWDTDDLSESSEKSNKFALKTSVQFPKEICKKFDFGVKPIKKSMETAVSQNMPLESGTKTVITGSKRKSVEELEGSNIRSISRKPPFEFRVKSISPTKRKSQDDSHEQNKKRIFETLQRSLNSESAGSKLKHDASDNKKLSQVEEPNSEIQKEHNVDQIAQESAADMSALTTLAAVSELSTTLDSHRTLNIKDAVERNVTVLTERELNEGQMEIANIPAMEITKPMTLSNFSMDFSESFSETSNIRERKERAIKKKHESADMSLSALLRDKKMASEINKVSDENKTVDQVVRYAKENKVKVGEEEQLQKVSTENGNKIKITQSKPDKHNLPGVDIEDQIPPSIVCNNKSTVESEMAILTDTNPETETIVEKVESTTSKKLLEILTDASPKMSPKPFNSYSRQKKFTVIKAEGGPLGESTSAENKAPRILNKFAPTNKLKSKPIILSEKVIKPTGEVSVQKITSKRSYQDVDDIDAFIIQKPMKRAIIESDDSDPDYKPNIKQPVKKSSIHPTKSTSGKAKILQQTIITPAGNIIQPNVSQSEDSNMFDINSMPIVLSDQILTPENIDRMPIVLQDSIQTTSVQKPVQPVEKPIITTVKKPVKQLRLLTNKPTIIKKESPQMYMKTITTQRTDKVQKVYQMSPKLLKTNPTLLNQGGAKPGKFIIIPSEEKRMPLKRVATGTAGMVSRMISPEPTGNKIMIVTNQQGQQSRVLLTPAQQKMLGYQSSTMKIKASPKTILGSKSTVLSTTASVSGIQSRTTIPQSTMPIKSGIEHQLMVTPKGSRKIQIPSQRMLLQTVTRTVSTTKTGNTPTLKTTIIKNQQGQTIKKLQAADDALLDQQVQEQIQAIKASGAKAQAKQLTQFKPIVKQPPKRSYAKKIVTPELPTPKQNKPAQSKMLLSVSAASSPKAVSELSLPPLAPISPSRKVETPELQLPTTAEIPSVVPEAPVEEKPKTERPLNQLVIQDALGNQTTITEGQILALPSETVDGQPQSYMLVTLDETGNLTPLNNEALMSLDPNLGLGGDLSNIVLQVNQETPAATLEATIDVTANVAPPTTAIPTAAPIVTPEMSTALQPAEVQSNVAPVLTTGSMTTPIMSETQKLPKAGIPVSDPVCTLTNQTTSQQLIVTGDPVAAQKLLESLTEGNADLANILASAEGSILIQADGQQILINTDSDNQMLLSVNADNMSSESTNVIYQPSKSQDILAAALADTDVFQQENTIPNKGVQSQLSPNSALYPMNTGNVLETSLTLSSPIMTPLEVPSNNSKKIPDEEADILTQVPKNVDLPITITDPNISQTVAQQQVATMIANELQNNLELPLGISEAGIPGSSAPTFMYSLPSLDDTSDISQKPFTSPISMPSLSEDPEDVSPKLEETVPAEGVSEPEVKESPTENRGNIFEEKIEEIDMTVDTLERPEVATTVDTLSNSEVHMEKYASENPEVSTTVDTIENPEVDVTPEKPEFNTVVDTLENSEVNITEHPLEHPEINMNVDSLENLEVNMPNDTLEHSVVDVKVDAVENSELIVTDTLESPEVRITEDTLQNPEGNIAEHTLEHPEVNMTVVTRENFEVKTAEDILEHPEVGMKVDVVENSELNAIVDTLESSEVNITENTLEHREGDMPVDALKNLEVNITEDTFEHRDVDMTVDTLENPEDCITENTREVDMTVGNFENPEDNITENTLERREVDMTVGNLENPEDNTTENTLENPEVNITEDTFEHREVDMTVDAFENPEDYITENTLEHREVDMTFGNLENPEDNITENTFEHREVDMTVDALQNLEVNITEDTPEHRAVDMTVDTLENPEDNITENTLENPEVNITKDTPEHRAVDMTVDTLENPQDNITENTLENPEVNITEDTLEHREVDMTVHAVENPEVNVTEHPLEHPEVNIAVEALENLKVNTAEDTLEHPEGGMKMDAVENYENMSVRSLENLEEDTLEHREVNVMGDALENCAVNRLAGSFENPEVNVGVVVDALENPEVNTTADTLENPHVAVDVFENPVVNLTIDAFENPEGNDTNPYLEEEGLCTLGGAMCSSLSEPPPDDDMFDLTYMNPEIKQRGYIPDTVSNDIMESNDIELQKESDSNSDRFALCSEESINSSSPLMSKNSDSSSLLTDENSCEIPVQPDIVTDLSSRSFQSFNLGGQDLAKRNSSDEIENESKRFKLD